jgi:RNA recognition motif-containing protein
MVVRDGNKKKVNDKPKKNKIDKIKKQKKMDDILIKKMELPNQKTKNINLKNEKKIMNKGKKLIEKQKDLPIAKSLKKENTTNNKN